MELDFNEANKQVHPVEKQWCYPILTKYGFTPLTKSAEGFVRGYVFTGHGYTITYNVGASCDYWSSVKDGSSEQHSGGYWSSLEPYLKQLTAEVAAV